MIHSLSPSSYKPPCLFCTYFPALQERHSRDYQPKLKPDSKVTSVKSQSSPTLTGPVFGARRGMQESLHQVVWVVVVQDTAEPLRAGMGGRHVQGQPVIHRSGHGQVWKLLETLRTCGNSLITLIQHVSTHI